MATTFQLKRSSVASKQPNTSTLSVGELAINLTDKKLYSSNGTAIFEPAANVTNLTITSGIYANGSYGSDGQVLTSNGSVVYWANSSGSSSGGALASGLPTGDWGNLSESSFDAFGVDLMLLFDCAAPNEWFTEDLGALA